MRRKSNGDMKALLLNKTLELIEEHGGALSVNMRAVARAVGCSAQNVYNYYASYDEMLNDAMVVVASDFHNYLERRIEGVSGKQRIEMFVKAFIQYGIDNPGRFNFYYLEKHDKAVYLKNEQFRQAFSDNMKELILLDGDRQLDKATLSKLALVKDLMVGRLAPIIVRKEIVDDQDVFVEGFTRDCMDVINLIMPS